MQLSEQLISDYIPVKYEHERIIIMASSALKSLVLDSPTWESSILSADTASRSEHINEANRLKFPGGMDLKFVVIRSRIGKRFYSTLSNEFKMSVTSATERLGWPAHCFLVITRSSQILKKNLLILGWLHFYKKLRHQALYHLLSKNLG